MVFRAECAPVAAAAAAVICCMQNPNVHGVRGKINTFHFDKETLERAGMGDAAGSNTPPFLVGAATLVEWVDNRVFGP
jgi:hypothetical protein